MPALPFALGATGPVGRAWGWIVAITGMIGIALLTIWGEPLLGAGLVALAVSGAVAPLGVPLDPRSARARGAVALSALGTTLVLIDLLLVLGG